MNRNKKLIYINILLVLSLFTAGISPACKFISGQQNGFIEICTAFGIKTIPMPEGGAPPTENKHKVANQCLFCFSAQVNKVIADSGAKSGIAPYEVKTAFAALDHQTPSSYLAASFEARAPPYIS